MTILVINAGSSSVKYQLFDMQRHSSLATGLIDRIGEPRAPVATHQQALEQMVAHLRSSGVLTSLDQLSAIGHRVVHGGEQFSQPTLIDADVIQAIRDVVPLAPLHNPAHLKGIEVMQRLCPTVPQVAVFDTAFHQSMPDYAFHYPLPVRFYEEYRVRRYGFHGTSHHYVAKQAAAYLATPIESLNLITLHLGNGCSAAAIQAGRCIDTSMGMTPLEGLMMGTRCGDIDPALHFYLLREAGLSPEQLEKILNKESGLKGVCGSSDMREVTELASQGNDSARLAREMFAYRIKKTIGSYYAALGRVDAIIFTGGIGENAEKLRRLICTGLEGLGICIAPGSTDASDPIQALHSADSRVQILAIPTNEELEIARGAQQLVGGSAD